MEQSVESNSFKTFKVEASLSIRSPYNRFFFKKRLLRKSSKPEHWNLVLITPTAQVKI